MSTNTVTQSEARSRLIAVQELAERAVEAAGQAGGIDEIRRLAEHGWPADRALEGDSAALREAIQARATEIAAEVSS